MNKRPLAEVEPIELDVWYLGHRDEKTIVTNIMAALQDDVANIIISPSKQRRERESSPAGLKDEWQKMVSAPKDGTTIEGLYDEGDIALICWSQRPVCMGGPTVYNKPGWATAPESDTDTNLPMDTPLLWRLHESPMQSEGAEERGIACRFAEWADENYFRLGNSNKWNYHPGDESGIEYTTEQLYEMFISLPPAPLTEK